MCNRHKVVVKFLLCIAGSALIGIGVTFFIQSHLGSDPTSVWIDGLHATLNIPIGNASLVSNSMLLLIAFAVGRQYIFAGTVVGALLTGPTMNLFQPHVADMATLMPVFAVKILMMILGHFAVCAGIALNLVAQFGFSPIDCIITAVSDRTGWKYRYLRIAVDASLTIIGFYLGGIVGIGTVLSVLTGGPLISEIRERCIKMENGV